MYHEANAAYKLTCQNARTQLYINLVRSLDSIANIRAYWRTIRKLKENSFVKSMEANAYDLLTPPDWRLSPHGCITGQVEILLAI